MLYNSRGHDSDCACPGDQYILAENREGQSGVDCVAERIENRTNLQINAGVMTPDVGHGKRDVFGKCTGAINSNTLGFGAEMTTACQAIAAASADHVAFSADDLSGMK